MDASLCGTHATRVRLRVNVFVALASSAGATTHDAQAALVGIHKSNLHRLKNGKIEAKLCTALRMAQALGTTVEVLFEVGADK